MIIGHLCTKKFIDIVSFRIRWLRKKRIIAGSVWKEDEDIILQPLSEFLKEDEYWTQEEEESYITASLAVKDAYDFAMKMPDSEQRTNFENTMLPEQEANLKKIQKERTELVEPTVETICDKTSFIVSGTGLPSSI